MPTNNILANLFTTIFNTEDRRKNSCIVVPTSKLGLEVLKTLKNEEIIQFVMTAGFSSKEEATDMSGRGVGLDAIKFEAERMKGKAWVESKPNKGSKLFVEVPLYQGIKK